MKIAIIVEHIIEFIVNVLYLHTRMDYPKTQAIANNGLKTLTKEYCLIYY